MRYLHTGLLALAVAMGLAGAAPAGAQARFDMATTTTRLSKDVLPSHVRLRLSVDPGQDRFDGEATISVRVLRATPSIVLHAVELEALAMRLESHAAPRELKLGEVNPGDAALAGTWTLQPTDGQSIAAGRYRLQLRYRGTVNRTGQGLFRAPHSVQGQPAQMLATQLEAIDARRLMPSFDEPVFRTVFELEVRAPADFEVLSNTPRVARTEEGAFVRHRFAPTPPMPSYLLALAVGRFAVIEDHVAGLPLRIFTPPGKQEGARYAMGVTQQLLPFYAAYFGRPYALAKLDQLSVPGTRLGAMEDWGLISYSEGGFLYDPARDSPSQQRRVYSIVAHEVAHQWFGNLVSVASWNDIWLNEAFATWMEAKATDQFHPEWQSPLRRRIQLENTLARDATPATRAIRSGPVSESSVFEVFDGITYNKGGAVLSMIEEWVGAATFQRGIAAYMRDRAMQPATAGDLWFHIGRAAARPVAAVAASWIEQPGLPLLDVSAQCVGGATRVQLTQQRFTLGEPLPTAVWQLPLLLLRGDERHALLMTDRTHTLELPGCDERAIVANANGRGYYRVRYDAALHARLTDAFIALPPAARVAVLSDSYALVEAGLSSAADHLKLLERVAQVQDASRAALFTMASNQWRRLDLALRGTPAIEPLHSAGIAWFGPELVRIGWLPAAGEDSLVPTLRADLIQRLAAMGHAPTLAAARLRLAAALDPASPLPGSLRTPVLQAVGSDATAAEFDALWARLHSTERESERRELSHALALGRDPSRAARLLAEALSGRWPADLSASLPGAVAQVPEMAPQVYAFVLEHWRQLAPLASDGAFGARSWLLPGAVGTSNEGAIAEQMIGDQRRLLGAAGAAPAQSTAAAIRNRQRLREREGDRLAEVLSRWPPAGP